MRRARIAHERWALDSWKRLILERKAEAIQGLFRWEIIALVEKEGKGISEAHLFRVSRRDSLHEIRTESVQAIPEAPGFVYRDVTFAAFLFLNGRAIKR